MLAETSMAVNANKPASNASGKTVAALQWNRYSRTGMMQAGN